MVNKPDKNVSRLRRHRRVRGKISAPQRARVSMCSAPPNIFMPSLSMTWPA